MLTGFNWILRGRLAGSGRPGLLAELDEDMAFLRDEGFSTIVTLTERPVAGLEGHDDLALIHFPIPDMGFPVPRDCAEICSQIIARMNVHPVLLHCRAGLGRTGTLAACCLVAMGEDPLVALHRVRLINPRYVQTRSQEQFIGHFAVHLKRCAAAGSATSS